MWSKHDEISCSCERTVWEWNYGCHVSPPRPRLLKGRLISNLTLSSPVIFTDSRDSPVFHTFYKDSYLRIGFSFIRFACSRYLCHPKRSFLSQSQSREPTFLKRLLRQWAIKNTVAYGQSTFFSQSRANFLGFAEPIFHCSHFP